MADHGKNLARNVKWELARIREYPAVTPDSVKLDSPSEDKVRINFNLRTDLMLDAKPEADIREYEPLALVYDSTESIGRELRDIISTRQDFPRDLKHLNLTRDSDHVSLCVSRTGPQTIYERFGVWGILFKISKWLSDAKVGRLMEDGWELVPAFLTDYHVFCVTNSASLQKYAINKPTGGYAFVNASVLQNSTKEGKIIFAFDNPLDTNDSSVLKTASQSMSDRESIDTHIFRTNIPLIFCWPDRKNIEHSPRFNRWMDIESLEIGLGEVGVWDLLDEALLKKDILLKDGKNSEVSPDSLFNGRKGYALVVGLWRPKPIDPTVIGLVNDNDNARSLELRYYFLERSHEDSKNWSNNAVLYHCTAIPQTSSKVLEAISGEKALKPPLVIGAGALGSAIIDFAVRGGTIKFTIIDHDFFSTHNIARHRGTNVDVGQSKVDLAERLLNESGFEVQVEKFPENILKLSHDELKQRMSKSEIIIDTTAEPLVRTLLSQQTLPEKLLARSEIFHKGRLAVTLLTKSGSIHSLNCLFHQTIELARTKQYMRDWLLYENSRNFLEEELLLGFGCSTLTTKMPAYRVDSHAAAVFSSLKQFQANNMNPLISLHRIGENGLTKGVVNLIPNKMVAFSDENTNGWQVLISKPVLSLIRKLRKEKSPLETGGYLYGYSNDTISEIGILFASSEPPNTRSGSNFINLGPSGQTVGEKTFMHKTCRRLHVMGAWHSHPSGTSNASAIDWDTFKKDQTKNVAKAVPTVMMITGLDTDKVYVSD